PLGIRSRQIKAYSATDIWAVGTGGQTEGQPAISHWSGSVWKRMAFPKISGIVATEMAPALNDVAAYSAKDVWAVGSIPVKDSAGKLASRSLLAHWNGTRWATALGKYGTSYSQIERDGSGGIWIQSGSTELRHRSKSGAWATYRLAIPAGK